MPSASRDAQGITEDEDEEAHKVKSRAWSRSWSLPVLSTKTILEEGSKAQIKRPQGEESDG
ncbi:MAG: hypothetical protein WBF33_19015 [Candidatus Nitrosopolaris sp.]